MLVSSSLYQTYFVYSGGKYHIIFERIIHYFNNRYIERFSVVILQAAILMIACQLTLLYIWVQINKKNNQIRNGKIEFDVMNNHDEVIENVDNL